MTLLHDNAHTSQHSPTTQEPSMYDLKPNHQVRERYVVDQLDTSSNAKILTLCFDRLDRDLASAQAALERGDHYATNDQLGHAQDLLGELATMLDVEAWDHAGSLLAIYDYVLRLLAVANLEKAPALVTEAQQLITEIGDAFRAATAQNTRAAAPAPGLAAAATAGDTSAQLFGSDQAPAPQRFSVRA